MIKVIDNLADVNDELEIAYKIYNIGNNFPTKLLEFTYVDVSSLIKDFEYKPNTDLAEGIVKFVKCYKEFYK